MDIFPPLDLKISSVEREIVPYTLQQGFRRPKILQLFYAVNLTEANTCAKIKSNIALIVTG